VFRDRIFAETEYTIIGEPVQKLPVRKLERFEVSRSGGCAGETLLARRSGVQVIVEVGMEAGDYVSEQYQRRIAAPSRCPNCGVAQTLEAHGYYWRYVTEALGGEVLQIAVRRFLSVLRGDGQLSAALCAALSTGK
jgi:hypothetical protein